MMALTKYDIFLKAVECGNFTRAADALYLTQSGVSHAVAALEEELGLTLLSRSRGGVTLTADGYSVLPYIRKLCEQEYRLQQKAADLRGLETGVVRIATFSSVSIKWLPYLMKTFQEQYPGIEFELTSAVTNSEIEELVMSGQVDCGFLRLPQKLPVDCWLLQQDQWKIITACNHPLAGRDPFPLEQLKSEPFILLEEGDDYEIGAVFDQLGFRPNVKYSIHDEDQTILAMVSIGMGISLMPELLLEHCGYPLAKSSLPVPFYRNIGICVKDKNAISLSTQRFVTHAQKWVTMHREN